ncbi:hypothetical protein GIB67_039632 [Kingdonia uniflora]|uniref:Uncharacterized protein n=1 Tax=Kingdonia uniflora TaxID=39325 RepID=A0A7J7MDG6_9MAGN|nr:hypothetical protein GIB67_039632 [Kingdonia uniflora]
MVAIMDDEFKKFARALRGVQLGFQDRSIKPEMRISQLEGEKNQLEENLTRERKTFQLELEKEREAAALKLKEVRAESVAEAEQLVTTSATSRNNLTGKLYQLRYTKAEIMAFSEGNYEEKEIMDEEEVEEMEDGLSVAEKTAADNHETINQEIESSRLRVADSEGLPEVEKKSSAELQAKEELAVSILQDKRDGEIASGEGSREMKEFLRRKENETSCIAHHCKDNKRAAVIHQAFKELVVHEQEKCDGEALHQRQLSALVAFFVEEIKFLQVERDLMQDCFSGRTCVCKLDISSIDPIGVMNRGIGTTTAEQIARGKEIVTERAPEYMASRIEIGGSSSGVSPTPVVGGRSVALPSRKSSRVIKK